MKDIEITEQEEKTINLLGSVWAEFLKLPEEHVSDRPEFCHGIHVLQNLVASRPFWRYLGRPT